MICNTKKYIGYLGKTTEGRRHDYKMFKTEIPPSKKEKIKYFFLSKEKHPFINYEVWVDLGFLGIEKDYQGDIKAIVIPEKKPRKSKKNPNPQLTERQKADNRAKSRIRVKVENSICGAKRFGIVTQVFRNKDEILNDSAMEIVCGLWNLHLKLKDGFT